MNTYIVLFRGINVGGRNILPMKELASLLEENGFLNVKTYIQSGNVVLQSAFKPMEAIGKLVEARFGFEPKVLTLDISEFELSVKNNPFQSEERQIHSFSTFAVKPPVLNTDKLNAMQAESEQWELIGKVFYLYAPDGIGRSKLVSNIEACLGVPATGRNLNTINKLRQMLDGG